MNTNYIDEFQNQYKKKVKKGTQSVIPLCKTLENANQGIVTER